MHHSFVLRHISRCHNSLFFFFNDTATTEIYTLSLHDALPISSRDPPRRLRGPCHGGATGGEGRWRRAEASRSEEHTSELQSPCNLVCRLLLEKKKKYRNRKSSEPRNRVRLATVRSSADRVDTC